MDPEPVLARVGGVDFSVGGWSRYTLERRADADLDLKQIYRLPAGQRHIGVDDVVATFGGSLASGEAYKNAAEQLASALERYEERAAAPAEWARVGRKCRGLCLPDLHSADVRAAIATPQDMANPAKVGQLARAAAALLQPTAIVSDEVKAAPANKASLASIDDNAAIRQLEASALPILEELERAHAAAATAMDSAVKRIDRALVRG